MIEDYRYGFIAIDGKPYNYDVEVLWTGEVLKWWRKESHVIDVEDVSDALRRDPEIIVIGTGESGRAEVTDAARKAILSAGIELIIDRTEEAVKTFNVIS